MDLIHGRRISGRRRVFISLHSLLPRSRAGKRNSRLPAPRTRTRRDRRSNIADRMCSPVCRCQAQTRERISVDCSWQYPSHNTTQNADTQECTATSTPLLVASFDSPISAGQTVLRSCAHMSMGLVRCIAIDKKRPIRKPVLNFEKI